MDCSILISTRNRADALERTLQAFHSVMVPDGLHAEMILVDNGSTDHTPDIIARSTLPHIELRPLLEPLPGKSRALNTALAHSSGRVLLFTDDDVVPAENWLERMSAPLLANRCDAVSGRVVLADDLRRPWLARTHTLWLAERQEPAARNPELVGASMGIRRDVFDRIPGFDLELGPGVTGLGEDTLLWLQMMELGMRILPVLDTVVVHHPDRSRLDHASWVAAARQQGRTYAYIWHHWKHLHFSNTRGSEYWTRLKLFLRVLLTRGGRPAKEGCPDWELSYRTRIETLNACRQLAGKPRNYPPPAERIQLHSQRGIPMPHASEP